MKNAKKIVALLLVIAITCAISVGLTVAYLTDRDDATNVFTVGDVDIDLNEDFEQGATLTPGVDIEKKPTITNIGKNDAWVWATVAVPSALDNDDASKNVVHFNYNAQNVGEGKWTWTDESGAWMVTTETINDVAYNVYTVLYQTPLKPGDETSTVIEKVYMDPHVDIDPEGNWHWVDGGNVTPIEWNTDVNGNPLIYVNAYAMQAEGFKDVQEAYEAYIGQWGGLNGEHDAPDAVSTDEEAKDALTQDEETIIVSLSEDITYDVAAWDGNAMGGPSTKEIIINGNGHTITFNNTSPDWNNVVTGDAVLTITDATVTNSGNDATSGTWNAHDIIFEDKVVFNNVVFENAIALQDDATLNNVTITDDSTDDAYGIWITPNGQTITIDGLKMDMTTSEGNDRGIKIDNQYLKEGEDLGVTLTVKNAEIKTDKKAAILVKSMGNVTITTENISFTGVVADIVNVDAAAAGNAANILHNGVAAHVE